MVKKGWLAISYICCFFSVYLATIAYSGYISVYDTYTNYTSSFTDSVSESEVMDAMSDIPGFLPIIVIAIIGALLIGSVSMFRAYE